MYLTYQFIKIFIYRDCFCQHLLSRRDTGNAFWRVHTTTSIQCSRFGDLRWNIYRYVWIRLFHPNMILEWEQVIIFFESGARLSSHSWDPYGNKRTSSSGTDFYERILMRIRRPNLWFMIQDSQSASRCNLLYFEYLSYYGQFLFYWKLSNALLGQASNFRFQEAVTPLSVLNALAFRGPRLHLERCG